MSVERIEAAIAKLEELRADATPTPWESDPDREIYARYQNERGVMVSQLGSLGTVCRDEDGWLVAVLTRTIDAQLDVLHSAKFAAGIFINGANPSYTLIRVGTALADAILGGDPSVS